VWIIKDKNQAGSVYSSVRNSVVDLYGVVVQGGISFIRQTVQFNLVNLVPDRSK